MSRSARSSSKRSDIIRIKRPSSVDPRQPNISYRIPDVSDYHSRCSSPADEMHHEEYFDRLPSQVKLSAIFPDKRKQIKTTRQMPVVPPKSRFNEKFLKKTIGSQRNYPVTEFHSKIISPKSQFLLPESQNMMSQRERMEMEVSLMNKTKLTRRLAQIVPHRIDQPYFMAGSTAMLSQRSQQGSANHSPFKSKTRTSKISNATLSSEYEIDGEELERLRLQADSRASRTSSSSGRENNRRQRVHANTPAGQGDGERTGQANATSLIESVDANTLEGGKNQGNENESADANAVKESSMGYRGNKIIQTGHFAQNQDSSLSLSEGMDLDFSQLNPPDFCIVSKKQKKAFEGMFNDIDFDSNGKVTFNELMHRIFSNVSKKNAKNLMQIFDINMDKTIDRREFIAICALNDRLCGYRTESKNDSLRLDLERLSKQLVRYKELFALLDQDDNNRIHVDEVMLIMTNAMGREIGMNEGIARSVIDYIDKDQYGYIDFVSFLTHVPFFLKLYKSMMDSTDIQLQELEQAREMIRERLRKSARSGRSKR